jgi:hypothetical protein
VSILLIICLSVSFFVIFNAADFTGKALKEKEALDRYKYEKTAQTGLSEYSDSDAEKFSDYIDEIINKIKSYGKANISFQNIPVYYNGEITNYNCSIMLKINEPLKLYDSNGDDVTEADSPCVISGETIAEHFRKTSSDGSFFIDNVKMPGAAVLRNDMGGGIDNRTVFIWDKCTDAQKEVLKKYVISALCSGGLQIKIESDHDASYIYDDISSFLQKDFGMYTEEYTTYYSGDYQNYWYKIYNEIFTAASLVFSVTTCFCASELWITRRKKELVIRKAFGYSDRLIFRLLAGDIIKLSVPSVLLAFLFQLIYNQIYDVSGELTYDLLIKILIIIAGAALIVFLTLQHAAHKVSRITVAEGIGG